jgi:hypothetical protein
MGGLMHGFVALGPWGIRYLPEWRTAKVFQYCADRIERHQHFV